MKLNRIRQIFCTIALIALIQGACCAVQLTSSGGSSGESGSVSMNFDTSKDSAVSSQIAIIGATVMPSTTISGAVRRFEQTHAVKDRTGKSASVYVKVLNAPSGLTYSSAVLPSEGNLRTTQPWVSAEQWLTVPKANSIKCTATASYGTTRSASVGLEEYKGKLAGDYVTLNGYYGKALTTGTSVLSSQTATSGAANSIKIYGSAKDSSGTSSVNTPLKGISGGKATFAGLSETSFAGTATQVAQKEHVHGTFTSTATYTPKTGTAQTKTRTSNYGTENDLKMKAAKGSLPTGYLGYYVKPGMKIQGAVNAAQSGDTINAAQGAYDENVALNKALKLMGQGSGATTTGFILNRGALLLSGTTGISASTVSVNNGAKIQDGVTLASSGGTVNVAAGIYNELVGIDKSLTVCGAGSSSTIVDGLQKGSVFTIASGVDVSLSCLRITNGKADNGGGILNSGTLTLGDCEILANIAENGGGIYNQGGAVIMNSGSSIAANTAYNGGGIYNQGGQVVMNSGSSIAANKATYNGGGIYNHGGMVIMNSGSSIAANKATNDGGGICIMGGGVTMWGGSIAANTAYNGSGIYIDNGGMFSIFGGSIVANTAANHGGGIYLKNGGYSLMGGTLTRNTPDDTYFEL